MSADNDPFSPDAGDVAPGLTEAPAEAIWDSVQSYLLGLGLAILLTVAAFLLPGTHFLWGPGIRIALVVLAIAQIGVHLAFFLHITSAPDNTNNILALAFGVLIVVLVVGGSIWIMNHLNANMMPG
jgi:cytochrome o ubiquinol oxidase operon protein cyoD